MLVLIQVVIDLIRKLVTLFEALVVGTHQDDSQIDLFKANVYVKHVLLRTSWYADRCPCFTIGHGAECHHEVENDSNVYRLKIVSVQRVGVNLPSALT